MMIGSLLVTVLLAGSPLKLNGDNISQIVNELTTEEKAALLVGSGAKAFIWLWISPRSSFRRV